MRRSASLWVSLLLAANSVFANEIEIQREYSSKDCVSGYLLVDGTVTCYVLERAWENNAPLVSSIPAGEYSAVIREDGKKGWRIELLDVPDREHVQIHIGNTTADSVGCLLPGRSIASSLCAVYKSAEAMDLLRQALTGFSLSDSDSEISVTIRDGGGLDTGRVF
jgi:hypothetical protein